MIKGQAAVKQRKILNVLVDERRDKNNYIDKEQIPEVHPQYAVIYFYRTGNYVKTPYDVHLNNEVVYRSKNKTKAAVKVYTAGDYEIWGKTESKESLKLKVELGCRGGKRRLYPRQHCFGAHIHKAVAVGYVKAVAVIIACEYCRTVGGVVVKIRVHNPPP